MEILLIIILALIIFYYYGRRCKKYDIENVFFKRRVK